ncbi:hypothetical protein THRCLA_10563 [Thraustotheca clavata]|uniref:Ankyrin repeat n=1 Tax=Thraustotheca clavata TaxID=74557 RepID=A0A1V9YKI2_9STRA|nr:hypothetical protein THRCLA_10563 [Thraustotheca clavata]
MDKAAEFGYFDIVKYLHENRTEGCTTYAMDSAAKNGHLEIVKYLHENRTEGCTANVLWTFPSFEITKVLLKNRTECCTKKAMLDVARKDKLDIIKYFHEIRAEGCSSKVYDVATTCTESVVNYLKENCHACGSMCGDYFLQIMECDY